MKTIHCIDGSEINVIKSGENIHIETPGFTIAVSIAAAHRLVDKIMPLLNENASPDLASKFKKQLDDFLANRKK